MSQKVDIEDSRLFELEMQGVKPLKPKHHQQATNTTHQNQQHMPGLAYRREYAVSSSHTTNLNPLSEVLRYRVGPHDFLEYKKSGLQNGVFKKLRLGKYHLESRLDLHRMSVLEAKEAVYDFLTCAYKNNLRTLLITHGKGDRGTPVATLKSYVAQWLQEIPEVLAYHSAQSFHGGSGAIYVLLKKSPTQKKENRKKFNRFT